MTAVKLKESEVETVIKALNTNTEIPIEIGRKLMPSFFEKLAEDANFDYQKLDKYKIPTIEYAGKRSETAIINQAALMGGNAPLEIERCFEGRKQSQGTQLELMGKIEDDNSSNDEWKNLIVQGDNLQFLKTSYLNQNPLIKDKVKGKVKLIYIDPPFGTGDEYSGSNGEVSYSAKLKNSEFIELVRERLIFLRELLREDGALLMRIDYHFGHYLKVILDEVFGKGNFRNEFVVNRIYKNVFGNSSFIPTSTDSIYMYAKTDKYENIFNKRRREEPRAAYWRHMDDSAGIRKPEERTVFGKKLLPPKGKHFKYNQESIDSMILERRIRLKCRNCDYSLLENGDVWEGCPNCDKDNPRLEYLVPESTHIHLQSDWTDIPGYSSKYNYPTENSEELLERIIRLASSENDLVIDVFAGSGTTAAVAEKLGRRWIMCDFGKHAIYTMQKRMLEIADSKALGEDAKGNYGKPAKPFCVVSVGAYDFSKIMNLRANKDIYIQFVCGLFNIGEVDEKLSEKYHLTNVYAEKEGDPVEVYPVWDDEYLKDVKIDKNYLQGIIDQAGGKLSGEHYIITPETCTTVGNTELENAKGEKVFFKILSFPYKILEEFARKQQLQEQPSSEGDINNLISSVGFYFNEKVEAEIEFIDKGLKIKHFATDALNAKGNKFEGLDALAMVLIDKDYDGNVFTMEEAVYAKDFKDDGSFEVSDLTNKVGIIVVDKHGNESELIILEK
ncbi:MAG: site-specific DNA-methyltransferase [Patescibacteria group bacterium]